MEDWTEKYRPKHLSEIVGNERAITALRTWASSWTREIPKKHRAVILSGKPGTGKTSSALALAHDMNWTILELNASDARNEAAIKRVATAGAVNETFDNAGAFTPSQKGGRKLIIFDEADNLYERQDKSEQGSELGDRGGKKAIVETIQITSQPIILIVNDYYDLIRGGGESLKQLCSVIQYYEVNTSQIVDLLKQICIEESIIADMKVLQTIADRCKGDVRSAVNDLQSLCLNRKHIDMQSLDVLGYRDREAVVFDVLREVFKTKNILALRDRMRDLDVPPEMFLLWVDENLPREYIDTGDLMRGYEAVSKADVFFGRVSRRQYYDLWSYACELMSGGVATAKTHNYGNTRYAFPTWMKDMKSSQSPRMVRDSVLKKIGVLCHNSETKSNEAVLPHFQHLFRNDVQFACRMKNTLNLTESEVKYLLGEKHLHKIKDILQCSEKTDEKQGEITLPASEMKTSGDKREGKDETRQPSIFDFSIIF